MSKKTVLLYEVTCREIEVYSESCIVEFAAPFFPPVIPFGSQESPIEFVHRREVTKIMSFANGRGNVWYAAHSAELKRVIYQVKLDEEKKLKEVEAKLESDIHILDVIIERVSSKVKGYEILRQTFNDRSYLKRLWMALCNFKFNVQR